MRAEQPWLVLGSPPCTWWITLVLLNKRRMDEQDTMRRDIGAKTLLHFACEIYEYQVATNTHFLHEHPAGAVSWAA